MKKKKKVRKSVVGGSVPFHQTRYYQQQGKGDRYTDEFIHSLYFRIDGK